MQKVDMNPKPQPPQGVAIPDVEHAISVQIETWEDICGIGRHDQQTINSLQNGYPRSFFHKYVQALFCKCRTQFFSSQETILLFPGAIYAQACKSYLTSATINSGTAAPPDSVLIFAISFGASKQEDHASFILWAAVFPQMFAKLGDDFWRLTGTGVSSRLAERSLSAIEAGGMHMHKELGGIKSDLPCSDIAYDTIRTRIAQLLERAPAGTPRDMPVTKSDVFLYPSGMSAIYHVHTMLLKWRGLESAIIGFPYELTIKMLETFGPSPRFFSSGTDKDIDKFEAELEAEGQNTSIIQAVWCECPSNPLLWTVDLERIAKIAKKYSLVLVVDETIGGFANIDVLEVADIIVTSLTKTFNGFADLLAGSVTLNPNSPYYPTLKPMFQNSDDVNYLFIDDAIQLELNSRDFLHRTMQLNSTAEYLVDYLYPLTANSNSIIKSIYYPKTCPSTARYRARMRKSTEDFTPGYGCLFTIEFRTVAAAEVFFNNFKVHKGPSFGANITLALPYVQLVLQKEKQWAAQHGLSETIVRISVGLEDKEYLLRCLKHSLAITEIGREVSRDLM